MGIGFVTPGGGGGGAASDVSLIPVAPDTSTTVQAGYTFLSRNKGYEKHVASLADLDDFAPADGITGERTITVAVEQTVPTLVIPDDEYLTFVANAGAWGGTIQSPSLVGNVAGGLIRGAPIVEQINIQNTGGLAAALDGTGAQIVALARTVLIGGASFDSCNTLIIENVTFVAAGFSVQDVVTVATTTVVFKDGGAPGFVGCAVPAAATIGSLALSNVVAEYTNPLSTVFDFDTALVSGPGAIVIDGSALVGVGIPFAAGSADETDNRVISRNGRNVPVSELNGASIFSDSANPVTASAADGVWTVVPHIDGGSGLGPGDGQARWRLVDTLDDSDLIPGTPPLRWGLRFEGPYAITHIVYYDVTALIGGGTEDAEYGLELDAAGTGTWVLLNDSVRSSVLTNRASQRASVTFTLSNVAVNARLRLVHRTIGTAANTDFTEFAISPKASF